MRATAPHCLYCGYNLTGLPPEARCPECGMVNVPPALREEVWHTVDSPRRLWGLMARPVARHPPGWWWALDRPGDVLRSLGKLARNAAVSFLIVLAATLAADSVVLQTRIMFEWYDPADPHARTLAWHETVSQRRLFNREQIAESAGEPAPSWESLKQIRVPAVRRQTTQRVIWDGALAARWMGTGLWAWLLLVWAYVAQVGLWTQIRQGLPQFARGPRTIVAAANYQSCKLVYLAVGVAAGLLIEVVARCTSGGRLFRGRDLYELILAGVGGIMLLAAATVWVGALRSDFTRQLIRSRVHAVRIVLMYALLLPVLTLLALGLAVGRGLAL